MVMFGLLPHEHKMSVLNFLLKRVPEYRPPIKSKDRLVFHVGFRRYSACPVFSQHTNANKHKVGVGFICLCGRKRTVRLRRRTRFLSPNLAYRHDKGDPGNMFEDNCIANINLNFDQGICLGNV